MEVGSFIELQFSKGQEYYRGEQVARLNTGRAAIYHALRCLHCNTVYLPYYQCETVREFLLQKGVTIHYYFLNADFSPQLDVVESSAAVVLVNYYGIIGSAHLKTIAKRFRHVIFDHSQAFFSPPLPGGFNVYSARKFIGVPDGAYVVGEGSTQFLSSYPQGYSSDTALFLLQRIEYGCSGKAYEGRMQNEARLDQEDISQMSPLTHTILDGTTYGKIKQKRTKNFQYACSLFDAVNQLNPLAFWDEKCVPMVYPLLIEDDTLLPRLLAGGHFQGHWWNYVRSEVPSGCFEDWLSRYMIPVTIDQRYQTEMLDALYELIF